MGVFELGNTIFVMEFLSRVISNACKAGVMDMQSDYDRVDTELTSSNMKLCITWTKNHKRGEMFWRQHITL